MDGQGFVLCFWTFLTGQICGGYRDAAGCLSSPEIVKKEMLVYIKKSSRTVLEAPTQVEDEEECWFILIQS